MATAAQIAELRRNVNELTATDTWSDEVLGSMIDSVGIRPAAEQIWRAKAAQVAHLVDISEGGSSRKMSDLHRNFLQVADTFADPTTAPGAWAPRTRRGERA